MSRVIVLIVVVVLVVMAISALTALLRPLRPEHGATKKDTMPNTFRNIAYGLLILLMLGVCSGLLGAA